MVNKYWKTRDELEKEINVLNNELQRKMNDNIYLYDESCKYKEWFTSLILIDIMVLLFIVVFYIKF